MSFKNRFMNWFFSIILIISISMMNVHSALADDGAPIEPPTATEAPTEAPVQSTAVPVDVTSTPEPPQATSAHETATAEDAPIVDLLAQVSEETNLVVLDENGEALSLASQDAAEIIQVADPIWCPETVIATSGPTPGANDCTASFSSIFDLLDHMNTNPSNYAANGVIYLERTRASNPATTITSAVVIDNSTYSSLYTNLNNYNLTLQGGWNTNYPNNPNAIAINGQTDFLGASAYLQIGSSSNPWVGNVTINDIKIGASSANGGVNTSNGLTVYTTNGDISLNSVDVKQQEGNHYTAYLQSANGDINTGPSLHLDGPNALVNIFDGNNASDKQNKGFSAATNSGSITISNTTFQDAFQSGSSNSYNGATLSAPVITMTNVIAFDNDGNGVAISNANTVTLNNVTGGKNNPGQGNGLSGVYLNGTGSTSLNVNAGTFNRNERHGIEFMNSTLNEQAAPSCSGNGLATVAEPCYNTESNPPADTPTNPGPNIINIDATTTPVVTPVNTAVTNQSNGSNSNERLIPVAGGKLIDLDCLTTINLFDITVIFFNLCDYQAGLNALNAGNLPGHLPDGTSFVMGLDLLLFNEGQVIHSLPDETGIQMDFSLPDGPQDQFAMLYWNDEDGDGNGTWIEISQQINGDNLSQIISADPAGGLYHISATVADANLYKILTTGKTGTFVLATK